MDGSISPPPSRLENKKNYTPWTQWRIEGGGEASPLPLDPHLTPLLGPHADFSDFIFSKNNTMVPKADFFLGLTHSKILKYTTLLLIVVSHLGSRC